MMANARVERWLFAGLSLAVFIYVLLRAALVPLVHDEATSFLAFAQTGEFLPFASMWDANNHYLSTALGALGYRLFGLHLLALRWASVLAFLLYACSAYRLGALIQRPLPRWCLWLSLFLCPLLSDFFSLYRGYGLAMAFLLWALVGAFSFVRDGRRPALLQALIGMALAVASSLSLLGLWTMVLSLLFAAGWRRSKSFAERRSWLAPWILLGLVPCIGAAGLSYVMARFGLLYHGGTEGFVTVTVVSLARHVLGSTAPVVVLGGTMLVAVASALGLLATWRARAFGSPLVIIVLLLWCEVMVRIVGASFLGINYAEDRTALHVLLLSLLLIAFAADVISEQRGAAQFLAIALLLLPVRFLLTANLDRTVLWPEQATPDRFAIKVRALEETLGRPAVVGAYRLSGLTWSLQQRMLGAEGDVSALGWPEGPHDVRIVDDRFQHMGMRGYAAVDSVPEAGLTLLFRQPRWATNVLADTSYVLIQDTITRRIAWSAERTVLGRRDLLLELSGRLHSPEEVLDLRLCVALFDTMGTPVHNDFIFLSTRRLRWKGEAFRTVRPVPYRSDVGRMELWYWNPGQTPFMITDGRALLRGISAP